MDASLSTVSSTRCALLFCAKLIGTVPTVITSNVPDTDTDSTYLTCCAVLQRVPGPDAGTTDGETLVDACRFATLLPLATRTCRNEDAANAFIPLPKY